MDLHPNIHNKLRKRTDRSRTKVSIGGSGEGLAKWKVVDRSVKNLSSFFPDLGVVSATNFGTGIVQIIKLHSKLVYASQVRSHSQIKHYILK
jgi:hypothetical protein